MIILIKYSVIYMYLLTVFGSAFFIGKILKDNEISRNIIHICAGMGWMLYKILFPASVHPIIISFTFVLLTVITHKLKISFIERTDGSYGTVYYTISMLIMSALGYGNPVLFDIFGLAIVCLGCGDASANIIGSRYGKKIIYKNKSIQGTVACFCSSLLAMIVLTFSFKIEISLVSIGILAVLCAITELFAGEYDNILIPLVVYVISCILIYHGFNIRFWGSIGIAAIMFIFAFRLKLLNISASYIFFGMMFVLCYLGGWRSMLTFFSIFLVIIVIEKYLDNMTNEIFFSINKEHGVRNERQLVANCFVAIVSVTLYGVTNNQIFVVAFVATIAETIGDSVASAVGVLSKEDPIDICTLKRTQRGISGGISVIGTVASLLVCVYSGLVYLGIYQKNIYGFVVIIISSFSGILLDSILGSRVQIQYKCKVCDKLTEKEEHCQKPTEHIKGYSFFDNSRINFLCNIFSFCVACIFMMRG